MVAAVAYLLIMTAGFIGVLPVLIWLFGEAPGASGFQNDYEKKEENEMLMFSGLETQSRISQLLDELYGGLGQASPAEAGDRKPRWPETPAHGEPIVEEEINEGFGATKLVSAP